MSRPDDEKNWFDSSVFYKSGFLYCQSVFRVFGKSSIRDILSSCGRFLTWSVKLFADVFSGVSEFISLLWKKSVCKKVLKNVQTLILQVRFFPSLLLGGILEGTILLLITFMPVLSLWWYLLPLLILLFFKDNAKMGIRKRFSSGTGLWQFWALFIISAIFSTGFKMGLFNMIQWSTWLFMAWLVYYTFSKELCKKVLKYILITSQIWLAIGYGQLFRGLPTPTGWLGAGESGVISVRIYSVFSNPNIYGLYLLSILILTGFFLDGRARLSGNGQSRWFEYFSMVMAGLTLGSLYFTYSRTAWLIAGVIILIWVWRRSRSTCGLRSLFLSLLIVAALLLLPGFKVRMDNLVEFSDSSFWYRTRIWKAVIIAIKDFWIWGIGPANFQLIYPLYQIGNTTSQHAHQLYLQLWLENGILSLIAFGRLIKNLFTGIRLGTEPYLTPLTVMLIVFLIFGFSETWWINRFCGGFFWLLAGLLISLKSKEPVVP